MYFFVVVLSNKICILTPFHKLNGILQGRRPTKSRYNYFSHKKIFYKSKIWGQLTRKKKKRPNEKVCYGSKVFCRLLWHFNYAKLNSIPDSKAIKPANANKMTKIYLSIWELALTLDYSQVFCSLKESEPKYKNVLKKPAVQHGIDPHRWDTWCM